LRLSVILSCGLNVRGSMCIFLLTGLLCCGCAGAKLSYRNSNTCIISGWVML
jgi:hypothetical protein